MKIPKNLRKILREKRAKAQERLTESQRVRNRDLRNYNIKIYLEREKLNEQRKTK